MFNTWKFAGYVSDVREKYAAMSMAAFGQRLDIVALARQRCEEHLLDAFCQECMKARIAPETCVRMISEHVYYDMSLPLEYTRPRREDVSDNSGLANKSANEAPITTTIFCGDCAQQLRVPVGRHLNVTCPKCRNRFEART